MKTPLLLSLVMLLPAAPVGAFELRGDWPGEPELVTLSVEHEPTSRALRLAAESAGIDLVATLPDDQPCTVRVRDAGLPAVLQAILGEQAVVVERTGRLIVVRPAQAPLPAVPPVAAAPAPPPMPTAQAALPSAPPATDRVTFSGDIEIRRGERVRDVVTMGGDAEIEGEVTGDVVTMGGDIEIGRTGVVHGDLVAMGGEIDIEAGGIVHGQRVLADDGDLDLHLGHGAGPARAVGGVAAWMSETLGSASRYALLFLLGLCLLGLAPERLETLRLALVKAPTRAAATGVVGMLAAVLLIVVLCITIIGIPAAVLLALAFPVALYVGMAAAAAVVGALLPVTGLRGRPVLQLGAGVGVLFLVSLLPIAGDLATALAAVIGFGTVVLTRFGKLDPTTPMAPVSVGPYR